MVPGAFAPASWSAALQSALPAAFRTSQGSIKTKIRHEQTSRTTLRFELTAIDDILIGSDDD
jgi:hypothetical protein